MIEVDYLVVGAGAMGMAFADVVLTESEDATVAIVDRRGRPGGHWNDAYPFVRLHQPSAFYGVNSRPLGHDQIDRVGWNAGLYELASASEVCAYFDLVMREQFLPSGRVEFLPLTEYRDGKLVSAATGATQEVRAAKVVDATYMNVTVPSMRPPAYDVADGVRCVPINGLGHLTETPDGYVIVGAGKTAMDACLWLLANQVDPDTITWIMPRDSWALDRANIQPGADFFQSSIGMVANQMEAAAAATSIDDLFDRLEQAGVLIRLDETVRPTMFRCATITSAELDQLRRIENVVRMGRVRSIGADHIELDGGTIPTTTARLHVDCTADGLKRRPEVPIFDGATLSLQPVRTCQQVFSAAFIAHVELTRTNDAEKNEICGVVPHPNSDLDWLRTFVAATLNAARWNADKELRAWLAASRLDGLGRNRGGDAGGRSGGQLDLIKRVVASGPAAVENVSRLLADHRETSPT